MLDYFELGSRRCCIVGRGGGGGGVGRGGLPKLLFVELLALSVRHKYQPNHGP